MSGKTLEQAGADNIAYRLATENSESIVHMLNRLFSSIDYLNYPGANEATLRAFVQVFFSGAGLRPVVKHHNAYGRSDLEVNIGNRHWVFEFKVFGKNNNKESILNQAVSQIEKQSYGFSDSDKTYSVSLDL